MILKDLIRMNFPKNQIYSRLHEFYKPLLLVRSSLRSTLSSRDLFESRGLSRDRSLSPDFMESCRSRDRFFDHLVLSLTVLFQNHSVYDRWILFGRIPFDYHGGRILNDRLRDREQIWIGNHLSLDHLFFQQILLKHGSNHDASLERSCK